MADKLSDKFSTFLDNAAHRDDVKKLFDALTKAITELKTGLETKTSQSREEMNVQLQEALTSLSALEGRVNDALGGMKNETDTGLTSLRDELKAEIEAAKALIPELPPEFDATALETRINEVEGKIIPPQIAEDIRNGLEVLPEGEKLAIDAIEGLRKELDEAKKSLKSLSGTMAVSIGHQPKHDSFTMNGSDTTVTLSDGVGAQGTAIILRYNGQTLDLTTHYTVSGNKITFVDFTPEADTIVSATYWP